MAYAEANVEDTSLVLVDRPVDGVARLTLNRPERRNALSPPLLDALLRRLESLENVDDVRCIVVRGAGTSFCAGADIRDAYTPDATERAAGMGNHPLWSHLEHARHPIVTAVQGHAIAGGLLLAVCTDIIVAAEGALFQDSHALWGLIPTGGEPQRFSRRLGLFAARYMMLTCAPMSAHDAWRLGLVAQVVPPDELDRAAVDVAAEVASHNVRAVQTIKVMINRGAELGYLEARQVDEVSTGLARANVYPDDDRDQRLRDFAAKRRKAGAVGSGSRQDVG